MNRKNQVSALLSKAREAERKGDYAASFFNLGSALALSDQFDEAAEAYRKAVRIAPYVAASHCGLADVLVRLGKFEEGEAEYRRALALEPNLIPARYNLARLMFEKGDTLQALELSVRLLASGEFDEARSLFVDCSRAGWLPKPIAGLTETLVRAIKEGWLRPNEVMGLAIRALELDPIVGKFIERAAGVTAHESVPDADPFSHEEIAALVNNQLLILVLESTPVTNRAMEGFVTSARAAMLERLRRSDPISADLLAFCKSLAIQCFITEYVFFVPEQEASAAQAARERVAAALDSGSEIAPILLVAVAAYFPLATLPGFEKILTRKWPAGIAALLDQQVREPLKELELEPSIPRLTTIEDRVSSLVQRQYDESPYPRWIKTVETGRLPKQIDEYLQTIFPRASLRPLAKAKLDILIAGTGTGRQAIEVARQFSNSRVLAIDLSRAALAYAKRKSDELGVNNIEYGEANILEVDALKRSFDVIYATGVLHHLADPFAGWRRLLAILAPRGVMNIGLYSGRGREDIVAAQRFLAGKGYKATPYDIRRCRNEFERLPTESPLRRVMLLADFYSSSELRDLLFHVQEHSTNLPQIARFLIDNDLQFLGFIHARHTLRRYHQLYPQDGAMIDLALWDRFEAGNPRTFVAMYQFWVQKTAN